MVHEQMHNFFRGFRRDSHPMATMVGVVGAMPLAVAAMFAGNRLLPWDLANRRETEITLFCLAWLLAAAWGGLGRVGGRGRNTGTPSALPSPWANAVPTSRAPASPGPSV